MSPSFLRLGEAVSLCTPSNGISLLDERDADMILMNDDTRVYAKY